MNDVLVRAYHKQTEKMVYQLHDEQKCVFWLWFDNHETSPPMLFTGLIDKSGKKAYVGDYYKRYNYLYEIVFDEKTLSFKGKKVARLSDVEIKSYTDKINYSERHWIRDKDKKGTLYSLLNDNVTEIIGNIYENQFMIKNKNEKN